MAVDVFAGVLGTRRGAVEGPDAPDSFSVAQVFLVELMRTGDIAPVVAELGKHLPLPSRSPLAQTLLQGVVETLATSALDEWKATAADVADVSGVRSSSEAETLVSRRLKRTVHVWPEGEAFPDRHHGAGKTLCGVAFELGWAADWGRGQRGSFAATKSRMHVCSRCRKLVAQAPELYPEATEDDDYRGREGLWPTAAHTLEQQLRTRLYRLFADALNDAAPSNELGDLRRLTQYAVREAYLDALAAEAERKAERVLTGATEHSQIVAQQLGLTRTYDGSFERELASWYDAGQWRVLLAQLLPQEPVRAGGQGDRWRRMLTKHTVELGAARGLPAVTG